jgi:uncharacterized membrane protein YfcA
VNVFVLVVIGLVTGLTTVLFGFGGGFVTVPVIVWADAGLGADAAHVAVATSTVVMVVNAGVATAATDRGTVGLLRRSKALLLLLFVGGAGGALAARWASGPAVHWVFVAYLAATIIDLLARPGFLRRYATARSGQRGAAAGIPAALGMPIGAIAAFVGVGGSVMTVPLLRRSGHGMRTATSLANPLTFAIAAPALGVFLLEGTRLDASAAVFLLGSVDLGAAAALLIGALPIILVLRRRPPRIPDGLHAWSYLTLLIIVTAAMVAAP